MKFSFNAQAQIVRKRDFYLPKKVDENWLKFAEKIWNFFAGIKPFVIFYYLIPNFPGAVMPST
jgi:hypothetical protein